MAITYTGNAFNSGNQANKSTYSGTHITQTNTKALVAIVTTYDSSASDSEISYVSFGGINLTLAKSYISSSGYGGVSIWYLPNPPIVTGTLTVKPAGTVTDIQVSSLNLISTTADTIVLDQTAEGTDTDTVHTLTISNAKTGSVALGGIVDVQAATTNLSVQTGSEIGSSEADMGSQVAGCAYAFESSGSITIEWLKSDNATSYAAMANFYEQNYPTIALNSPDASATVSDTTPDLTFTGTDANSDTLRYNVQVDTATSFDSQGTVTITDSLSESLQDTYYYIGASPNKPYAGQGFTAGTTGKLLQAKFYLLKTGSPTGSCYAQLYAHTGTYGTSSKPTGSALATSDAVDVSTLGSSYSLITFDFSGDNQYEITQGTNYCIIYYFNGGDSSNYTRIGCVNDPASHGGNYTESTDGSTWTTAADDANFYVYVKPIIPLINKVSGTDAGFSGSPDNTDPFTSGQAVTYTVQSALDPGTYYWRARAIDPLGSNTYSAWATTRSFTVSSGTNVTASASIQSYSYSQPTPTATTTRNTVFYQGKVLIDGFDADASFNDFPTGQSFSGTSGTLNSVQAYIAKGYNFSSGLSVYAKVYSITGTHGVNALPNTLLATSDPVSIDSLEIATPEFINFTFSGENKIALSNTSYILTIEFPEDVIVGYADNAHNGNLVYYYESEWNSSDITDMLFRVFIDNASNETSSVNILDPIISAGKNVIATVGIVASVFTSLTPTVTAETSVNVSNSPNVEYATYSQPDSSVSTIRNTSTSATLQSSEVNLIQPSLSYNDNEQVACAIQEAQFSTIDPSISAVKNISVSITIEEATLSTIDPSVSAIRNTSHPSVIQNSTFSTLDPSITTTKSVSISTAIIEGTFATLNPSVSTSTITNVSTDAEIQSASYTQPDSTISTTKAITVSPNVESSSFTSVQPSLSVQDTEEVACAVQSSSISQPESSVSTTRQVSVSAEVLASSYSQPEASILVGGSVSLVATIENCTFSVKGNAVDQQQTSTDDLGMNIGTTTMKKAAQSFTPSVTADLSNIQIRLFDNGASDSIQIQLYSDSNNSPNTLIATAINTIDATTLTNNVYSNLDFYFEAGITLSSDTKYWIVISRTGVLNNSLYYFLDGREVKYRDYYSRGEFQYMDSGDTWVVYDGGGWYADLYFKEYYKSQYLIPSTTRNHLISPNLLTSTVSQPEASVSTTKEASVSPSVQSSTFNTLDVSVSTTNAVSVQVDASIQSAQFSTIQPSLSVQDTEQIAVSVISASYIQPEASVATVRNTSQTAQIQASQYSQPTASVSTTKAVTIAPAVQEASYSQLDPSITATLSVAVSSAVQTATLNTIQPSLSVQDTEQIACGIQSVEISQPEASISAVRSTSQSPATQSSQFSTLNPSVSTATNITVSQAIQEATVSNLSPTITTTRQTTISPSVENSSFTENQPTIITGGSISLNLPLQSAQYSQPGASVSAIRNISTTATLQTATITNPSPEITAGQQITTTVEPTILTGTITAPTPTISTSTTITVAQSIQSATLSTVNPIVSTTSNQRLSAQAQSYTASQPSPTVTAERHLTVSVNLNTAVITQPASTVTLYGSWPYSSGFNPYTKRGNIYANKSNPYNKYK